MTDDLRAQIAEAVRQRGPIALNRRQIQDIADALLPLFDAHGRASAATALREAAQDIQMDPPDYVPDVLRDRADDLDPQP